MRIALVYDGVYPYSVGGGEKVFHDLARFLGQRHEVYLLGLHLWEGPPERTVAPNVHLVGVCRPRDQKTVQAGDKRSLNQALVFSAGVFRVLKRLGRIDVIDCMSTPYFPLYAACFRARLDGVPLVSTWLELWNLDHWREYVGAGLKARFAYQIEHFATRLPQHIISISPQTSDGLALRGIPPERLSTITPWADVGGIAETRPSAISCDILFVGRLIQSKGVGLLLKALDRVREEVPAVRCRIIGDGPERGPLEKLAQTLDLEGNVTFSGFLDGHADVIAAMKSSRVFVLPSSREGFGIVIVEAAACGLPCVTIDGDNNAARHLVHGSGIGAVCSPEPDSLAAALLGQLRLDSDTYGKMSTQGKNWAWQYDWTPRAEAYESIYKKVAGCA